MMFLLKIWVVSLIASLMEGILKWRGLKLQEPLYLCCVIKGIHGTGTA